MESFKEQQQDRIEEGKDLKHEDEMRDLSQIPPKELPGGDHKSLLNKISESISHVASTISEKVGLSESAPEGHEDLDKDVRKQVKKINKEILKHAAEKRPEVEKHSDWETALPKHTQSPLEDVKDKAQDVTSKVTPSDSTSLASKVKQGVSGISGSISHGADALKGKFSGSKTEHEVKPSNEWENTLPKNAQTEVEDAKDKAQDVASQAKHTVEQAAPSKPSDSTSLASKVKQGVSGISDSISHGVGAIKDKFSTPKAEEKEDDGTKTYKTVKDGFNESVDELKHEQRVEELGQEELSSKNPFQPLTSGSNEDENRTLGEKVKGGLSDASQKLSSTVGGVSQKVKSAFVHKENTVQDKENAQQIA